MKKAKERVIYDNYNKDGLYEEAKEYLIENGNEDPSENEIWNEVYFLEEMYYEDDTYELKKILDNGEFIAVGTCGRWDGNFAGGFIFNSWRDLTCKLFTDCDYFKFWDENGHLYMQCSHHDGTHSVEIRKLTEKGINRYNNWVYNWSDKTPEREIHKKLFTDSHYSKLINYAHTVWGCPRVEYEKEVG